MPTIYLATGTFIVAAAFIFLFIRWIQKEAQKMEDEKKRKKHKK